MHTHHTPRYETPGEDHVIMYRTVDSENIMQSTFNDGNEKPIGIQKSEVVEYKKGVLQSSSGTVKVTVSGPGQSKQFSYQSADSYTYDESFGSNELSGTGKYALKLQKCSKKSSVAKRNVNILEFTKSRLHAVSEKGNGISSTCTSFQLAVYLCNYLPSNQRHVLVIIYHTCLVPFTSPL